MKWDIMQRAMRHKDQVTSLEPGGHGRDEFVVKVFQMRLRGLGQRVAKGLEILRIQTKLGELKLQQAEQTVNPGFDRYRKNLKSFASKQANQEAVTHPKILHHQRVSRNGRADGCDLKMAGRLQAGFGGIRFRGFL